ncbi:MAG: protoporphyrinogen oxidase [Candidatus Rhabdochlamydia sp.]
MPKPTIIILGGGISGLTFAHELLPYAHLFDIHLLEKEADVGGWMKTDTSTKFFFERGPRVFRNDRSPHLLSLIRELQLAEEIIPVSDKGSARYVWEEGRLKKMPRFSWGVVKGLIRHFRQMPVCLEDESVWDFACRRFNETVAREVFDPLVTGIYGGNSKQLSFKSCFPHYARLEQQYGSLIKGMIQERKGINAHLFGLQRGVSSLITCLKQKVAPFLHTEEEVVKICQHKETFEIQTSQNHYTANYLFSALPPKVIGKLLIPELSPIEMKGAIAVHLGYHQQVLHHKGFGYLTPSYAQEEVLGVIFDSNAFPQHNRHQKETRVTVKLKDQTASDEEALAAALRVMENHLHITALPDQVMITRAQEVFPQFHVGYERFIQAVLKKLAREAPGCTLLGNYLEGISVNDCIGYAKKKSLQFLQECRGHGYF